jgi:hypothetical protein
MTAPYFVRRSNLGAMELGNLNYFVSERIGDARLAEYVEVSGTQVSDHHPGSPNQVDDVIYYVVV